MANYTNTTYMYDNATDNGTTPTPAAPPRPRGTPLPPGYYAETKETMWKVIAPIIIAWGIIGNILTVLVLLRQMRRRVSSTSMYLMALAFSDTVILLSGPLRNFILYNWEKDVRNYSDAGCRMQIYFTYASIHLSSWLLVAVTMERVLSVALPHKVRFGCTPKIAGIVILVTFLCVGALNISVAVINGRDAFIKSYKCAPTSKAYLDFRDDVLQWIDFCVAFAIPFIFLLVGNIVIITHLVKSKRQQRRMTVSKTSTRKTTSVSVLLVLLCFVFFTTMTPISVFQIYYPYRFEEIMNMKTYKEAFYAFQFLLFQHTVVNIVGYTNASFNFLMYVLSGSKFRKELKDMLLCSRHAAPTGKTTLTTKTTSSGKTTDTRRGAYVNNSVKESQDASETPGAAGSVANHLDNSAKDTDAGLDRNEYCIDNKAFVGLAEEGNTEDNQKEKGSEEDRTENILTDSDAVN